VIVHKGATMVKGHYVSYVSQEGDWFYCNDNTVKAVTENIALD